MPPFQQCGCGSDGVRESHPPRSSTHGEYRAVERPHRLGRLSEAMPEERKVDVLSRGGELAGDPVRRMLGGHWHARTATTRPVVTSR